MKHYKFEMGQRLEICGLPEIDADSSSHIYNGGVVTVVAMPGFHPYSPHAYGVKFSNGKIEAAIERYLRLTPPKDRTDLDELLTWEHFDAITGLKSIAFRRQNPDY